MQEGRRGCQSHFVGIFWNCVQNQELFLGNTPVGVNLWRKSGV